MLHSGPACCTITVMSWDTWTFTMLHQLTLCFRSVSSVWAASAAPRRALCRWWSMWKSPVWNVTRNLSICTPNVSELAFFLSFSSESFLWSNKGVQLWTLPYEAQYSGWEHKIPVHPTTGQHSRSEFSVQRDQQKFTILQHQQTASFLSDRCYLTLSFKKLQDAWNIKHQHFYMYKMFEKPV